MVSAVGTLDNTRVELSEFELDGGTFKLAVHCLAAACSKLDGSVDADVDADVDGSMASVSIAGVVDKHELAAAYALDGRLGSRAWRHHSRMGTSEVEGEPSCKDCIMAGLDPGAKRLKQVQ